MHAAVAPSIPAEARRRAGTRRAGLGLVVLTLLSMLLLATPNRALTGARAVLASRALRPPAATLSVRPPAATLPSAPHLAADATASGLTLVGEAQRPAGGGYWAALADGEVVNAGKATWYGDLRNDNLSHPVVGIAATRNGRGYWLVTSTGGVYPFGDAKAYGSPAATPLDDPVVGIARTPSGKGYWLVGSGGRVFAYGDAARHGSTSGERLNRPIVGMAATPDGDGYWLVGAGGKVFAFGDATRRDAGSDRQIQGPIVGMAATAGGAGYWLVAANGGVFPFGDAPYHGSAVGKLAGGQVRGIAAAGAGYWMLSTLGTVVAFDAPSLPSVTLPKPVVLPPALPPGVEPAASIAPSLSFELNCYGSGSPAACNPVALSQINAARATEGYGPLSLPGNYQQLDAVDQLVAVANAERTSRGLPSMPQSSVLDTLAQVGAIDGVDPSGPGGFGWGSNISWGYATPLAADFGWMYDDGTNSPNVDCPYAGASGCWGHRRNILAPWGGAMGAGAADTGEGLDMTQLFVENF